ncbi:hypothetical protein FUA23_19495 [Neolewinella aurantiaca]|uniref:Lipoprotein n=1 Tax=Neolewinella aurantiaca TaxID=2602767 RepID=A0A5C7FNL1_9BACT|nr:hypothetical protein [Neolewinella aurantiaca]TXF86305.1 hypothetical protein FUA23_19495 [Neolewinella aurantiaca]
MKSILSLFLITFPLLLACQTMPRFDLEGVATIEVSSAMELQNDAYRNAAKSYYDQHNFVPVPGRAVFQQSGVNERKQDALALYTRIIHETKRGAKGDFPRLGEDPEMSLQDIEEINAVMKEQMMAPQPMGIKITKWLGTNIVNLNGQYALHIAYERQMKSNPVVRVDRYSFFNDDLLQVLTMSYRKTEEDRWKKIHEQALASYRVVR